MALRFVALDLGNVLCDLDRQAFPRALALAAGVSFDDAVRAFDEDAWRELEVGALDAGGFRGAVLTRLGRPVPDDVFDEAWNLIPTARAGADALVARLALPHAIWSNTDPIHADHLARSLSCMASAVHLHLSHQARARKPTRSYYERGLAALGASAAEVLFVDDRPENRDGARALGIVVEAVETLAELERALRKHGVLRG
ncbi:MAG: HAD-IA family hydrolase [Deltaproteobacteria bacterium]|nr:HAD-IA family hydrolase [Deltaproteobacteria bacterium]